MLFKWYGSCHSTLSLSGIEYLERKKSSLSGVPIISQSESDLILNSGFQYAIALEPAYFDKMQDRIVNFVTRNSKITEQRFRQLLLQTGELVMDVGTELDGEKAVQEGLIDYLGGLSDAIECLYKLIEEADEKYPDDVEGK